MPRLSKRVIGRAFPSWCPIARMQVHECWMIVEHIPHPAGIVLPIGGKPPHSAGPHPGGHKVGEIGRSAVDACGAVLCAMDRGRTSRHNRLWYGRGRTGSLRQRPPRRSARCERRSPRAGPACWRWPAGTPRRRGDLPTGRAWAIGTSESPVPGPISTISGAERPNAASRSTDKPGLIDVVVSARGKPSTNWS